MNMFMGVPANCLCNRHLLGVHGELHKFLHNWVKQYSIDGYIKNHCIEPKNYKFRHDEVSKEMIKRGMNHKSPLEQPDFSYLPKEQQEFTCSPNVNFSKLMDRCEDCSEKIHGHWQKLLPDSI